MSRTSTHRVGLIVPSSNVTMETEIPAMIRGRPAVYDEQFTFHSSRMRMSEVTPEELRRMDEQSEQCAIELSDARCDVLAYACLIGIMAQGPGYHEESESKLRAATAENGGDAPVVTSAGALVRAFETLGARRIAVITPYLQDLTDTVIEYFEGEGVDVLDSMSLECPDNLEVARLDPAELLDHVDDLDHAEADAVVLSSCVQMPSLSAIQAAEDRLGKPVLSASVATTYDVLTSLGRSPRIEGAGTLLSGDL
jgi:maleate isomerase